MSFRVLERDETEIRYEDGAEYRVLPGGVLLVRSGDRVELLSADEWRHVVSHDGQFPLGYDDDE